ncbi:MAG: galactokinase [Defluviitaleaceae bacterium]|nr:galactokinase [Defluviitaleaceae bacterium]
MSINNLRQKFLENFGGDDSELRIFYAPGRVNLIGEHTDYNGGHVFPCALNFGTYGVARKRNDNTIHLISGNINLPVMVKTDDLKNDPVHDWGNYPKGVVAEIIKLGHTIGGFDFYIWGDIPNGSGLSSSASIELLTAVTLNGLFDLNLSMKEMVLLCQRAENQFVGVNCGIMDQYAVGMGKKDHAIMIDCLNLQHEYVPFDLGSYKMVITNTNKKHALVDSKYHERQSECNEALRILQQECDIEYLCNLDPETFRDHVELIKDPIIRNRATHVVQENARVFAAVSALNGGDLGLFGELMNNSHISLRDLYSVTGNELDVLAESAWKLESVLGSRMTGAGFGGCTVSIVAADAVEHFMEFVGNEYSTQTGLTAEFYVAETGIGAGEVM